MKGKASNLAPTFTVQTPKNSFIAPIRLVMPQTIISIHYTTGRLLQTQTKFHLLSASFFHLRSA